MEEKFEPLVSVIIPAYNVEKYLGACIESVILQSYKNLEIIIVDDGSPDTSGKIADSYALKDARIKVIHKENNGVAAARNTGFDLSKGEFVTYIDSDDWVSKDYISHLLFLQQIKNADMSMTTEFYTRKNDVQIKEKINTISAEDAATLLLSPKMTVGTCNKLYRRSWLVDNKIRQNENLFSGEGLNYIVTAAQYANFVTISNKKIYYYRRNVSESATTKFNIKMYTNNELSLNLLTKNRVINSRKLDQMIELFRIHLMINGVLAIQTYSLPSEYPIEYRRWREHIWSLGKCMLFKPSVPLKSKIRIICVSLSPKFWSKLARAKRAKIFKESV